MGKLYQRMKPFIGVLLMQFGFAGMDILSKVALNEGMSNYVFVVYRHAVAFIVIVPFAIILDKKTRPKMTFSIFAKLMLLSLLEPVIDQNLYFLGMKYTTATFATAMSNILPAITFVMAWVLRMEKLKINSIRSQAKVMGTVTTVAGAMIMTLVKGPVIELFRAKGSSNHELPVAGLTLQHSIKGSLMITVGCFSWAAFMNLQAITLKTYPAELSLTAWICLLGTVQGAIAALIMERGKASVWSINWDAKFLAAVYSGIVCSGFTYYIQGVIMKDRGPVFVTAFSPLSMVIVAVLSSFILAEQMTLGRYLSKHTLNYKQLFKKGNDPGDGVIYRVLGAVVIVAGLYLVIWGKSKDYKSESLITDKQIMDSVNNGDLIPCHEIITMNASKEGAITAEEQKSDKGNQTKPGT